MTGQEWVFVVLGLIGTVAAIRLVTTREIVHGALYRAGYEGDCIIEHEDRRFEGTDEKVKQGFLIARDVLRPYCH